jgi:hypothetical protein
VDVHVKVHDYVNVNVNDYVNGCFVSAGLWDQRSRLVVLFAQ